MPYVLVCCCFVVLFCDLVSAVYLPGFVGVVCFRLAVGSLLHVVALLRLRLCAAGGCL